MSNFYKNTIAALVITLLNVQVVMAQNKPWTKIVYIIGSDLESKSNAGTNDIAEMTSAGNTDQVNVVLLTGGANKDNWRTPKAYLIDNGAKISLNYTPVNNEMSSPENVTAFINWALEEYPGDKVSLVFWNHGSDIRGYGNDEISKKNLSLPQIKQALAATDYIKSNKKFELLGFDACLMANIETQSTLKEFANWFVGSEEQEPGHGWDYKPILTAMNSLGASLTGGQLGKIIVNGFLEQAIDQESSAVTLSVVDLAKLPLLELSLNNLFSASVANNAVQKLHRARSKAEEYSKSLTEPEYSEDMVDIGDMMKKLKELEPSLIPMADDVLAKLNEVVFFNRHDNARPKATGIAMYIPHQALVNKKVLDEVVNNHFNPIDFNPGLKNFIKSYYIPAALSDVTPPAGQTDPDFGFYNKNQNTTGIRNASLSSAVKVINDTDVEQVQVMLIKELEGTSRQYLMLGSTYPDTVAYHSDGSATYAYQWDDQWLSLNGHPAYISDIFPYDVVDSLGNAKEHTRIMIPAVKNLETSSEEFLIISYSFDENFNYTLESIIPEPFSDGSGGMIVPKRRVNLKAGDKIQLLYEAFNEDTDEEFFVVNDDAIINISKGNSDLKLGYSDLSSGRYQIGFLLEDYSQNDTLIFDDKVFVIQASGLGKIINDNNFKFYPNPASDAISVSFNEFDGSPYHLYIYDMNGQRVLTKVLVDKVSNIQLDLSSGMYLIEIALKDRRIIDKLIISK